MSVLLRTITLPRTCAIVLGFSHVVSADAMLRHATASRLDVVNLCVSICLNDNKEGSAIDIFNQHRN